MHARRSSILKLMVAAARRLADPRARRSPGTRHRAAAATFVGLALLGLAGCLRPGYAGRDISVIVHNDFPDEVRVYALADFGERFLGHVNALNDERFRISSGILAPSPPYKITLVVVPIHTRGSFATGDMTVKADESIILKISDTLRNSRWYVQ
jgi:hypothetical protein